MSVLLVNLLVSLVLAGSLILATAVDTKNLKCLVCKRLVEEIEFAINKVDPKKTIDIGSFRIDATGKQKRRVVNYARSQIHLMELFDSVCEQFKDYAQATFKSSGELTVIRLTTHSGNMNPQMSQVDMLPDPDLNKKLQFYCENIVEDNEDALVRIFNAAEENPDIKLCTEAAELCQDEIGDEYDFEDKDEL